MRPGQAWHIAGSAAALALFTFTLAAPAEAALISYGVENHPDGGAISDSVDADGYILRLDLPNSFNAAGVNTFNGNHSDVYFQWDPDVATDTAMLVGEVFHNESGPTSSFDGAAVDDRWGIKVTFKTTHLTDGEAPAWYGANDPAKVYDDMISDLLADANTPDPGAERSTFFSTDVARIYFEMTNMELTYLGAGTPAYDGPTKWDEFPNISLPLNGNDKIFYLQYRWRLWPGKPDFDAVAATGWLEQDPNSGQLVNCCEDLLFMVSTKVPEPGSLTLFGLGLIGLGILHRRRRLH